MACVHFDHRSVEKMEFLWKLWLLDAFRKQTKCPGKQLLVSYLCPCRDDTVSLNHYYDSGNEMLHSRCCFGATPHKIVRRSTVNVHTSSHFNHLRPWQCHESWTEDAVNGQCSKDPLKGLKPRGLGFWAKELSLFHGQGVQHWSLGSWRRLRVHKHRESFQLEVEVLYKSLVQKRQVKLRKTSQPWPDCVCDTPLNSRSTSHRLLSASLPQSKEPPGHDPGIQDRLYPPMQSWYTRPKVLEHCLQEWLECGKNLCFNSIDARMWHEIHLFPVFF